MNILLTESKYYDGFIRDALYQLRHMTPGHIALVAFGVYLVISPLLSSLNQLQVSQIQAFPFSIRALFGISIS